MKVHYLRESSWQSISSLKELLSDDFSHIINELARMGIYKEEKHNYRIEYVGIISFNKVIIAILPKFFPNNPVNQEQELKIIMQVLKTHAKKSAVINDNLIYSSTLKDNQNTTNRLALIDDILSDYIQNGLYKSTKQQQEINGDGHINWDTTIDQEQAYIINDLPIYLDLHTNYMISDNDHYITRLHKYILIKAINELKTFPIQSILTDLIHLPNLDFTYDTDHFINTDLMTNAIDNELQDVLHERKIILLKNMKAFINNQEHNSERSLKLWGIQKFWMVWESICKHIFNDESLEYNKKISQPYYQKVESICKNERATFIPDIVIQNDGNLLIIDAKYYNFSFCEKGELIGKPPELESITKQFAYALAFSHLDYKNIQNYFCIPTYEAESKVIGSIHFKVFQALNPIKIIQLSHQEVFNMYVNNKSYSILNFL